MDHDETAHADHPHGAILSWWELWPMLAWGAYTLYLYATGRIFFLLQSIYGHLAAAGGAVLLVAFAYGWVLRWRGMRREREAAEAGSPPPDHACECQACAGKASVGRYVRSLAFIVPLAIGLTLPKRGPNSLAAIQWGAGDVAMTIKLAAQRETERAESRRGYGWVTLVGAAQRLGGGGDEKIGTMGFVARKKDMPEDQFLVVRFIMSCCAACAQPVAVPVRWAEAKSLEKDQWVEVYGQVDKEHKILVADEVVPIVEPKAPYL